MTTHRRPAHHYGTGSAAVVGAAILAACGALLLAAVLLTARTAGPVTGAPGPEVLRPPAASVQITVKPDAAAMRAVWHAGHLRHLAHAEREHAGHVRHLEHLNHLATISSE